MFCEYFSQLYQLFTATLLAGALAFLPFYLVYRFCRAVWRQAKRQKKN
ncbi:MAG: hypothetical protein ACOX04_00055 [Candidatus Scatomorpha sp.]|jgi:hypothetical protein